jgi:two-component sensor histidine kinase
MADGSISEHDAAGTHDHLDPRSAEADHRVANSLNLAATMLRMQRERTADCAARSAILSAETRIVSIARFHAYLHRREPQGRVDLADFLRETLPDIGKALGLHSLLAVNASVAFDVPERVARQLMIVLNELALNARKHGYGGREGGCISVELDADGDKLLKIKLCDSGSGLPDGFNPEKADGLGLRIVTALVHELGGALSCHTDGGAHFTISIPLE